MCFQSVPLIFLSSVYMGISLWYQPQHTFYSPCPTNDKTVRKAKSSVSCSFPHLYERDNEHYLNGAISWRFNSCYQYELFTVIHCYSQYGVQTSACQRLSKIMKSERWICSIMQKRYNAIHHFLDEILARLVWQCKVFLLTHQRRIPGSVRKLLGWSTMAACTESWGLNKNESEAVWLPAERLSRSNLIHSVNPWTAHSCQCSILVWGNVC